MIEHTIYMCLLFATGRNVNEDKIMLTSQQFKSLNLSMVLNKRQIMQDYVYSAGDTKNQRLNHLINKAIFPFSIFPFLLVWITVQIITMVKIPGCRAIPCNLIYYIPIVSEKLNFKTSLLYYYPFYYPECIAFV